MLSEEEKKQGSGGTWKTYSRSASWTATECLPRKSNNVTKHQWNSKARACLPPLSLVKPSPCEWPKPSPDDLCIWPPNPPTPGARRDPSSASDQSALGFQSNREDLTCYDKDCSRVLDHIYLGSKVFAKNREALRENGITHVLNCVGHACPEYYKDGFVYKTLWLRDCMSEDITSILYDVFDYFEDVREHGGRVFVHCSYGISRSTSLVIAYLMWKEKQSYDDAFERVRAARRVTDPNMGFISQLWQYQKRVHALPLSPTSMLTMYRVAPHSSYDPLHLVPKLLNKPGLHKLDSRGAFIIRVPSAIFVWIGKHCSPMMSDNALSSALQIFRYEKGKGPVVTVQEGKETREFWDALSLGKGLPDKLYEASEVDKGKRVSSGSHEMPSTASASPVAQIKLEEYDSDFEVFERVHYGGVIPALPLSEWEHETCLPSKDNDWNVLRTKFNMKDSVSALQLPEERVTVDSCGEPTKSSVSSLIIPSNGVRDSPAAQSASCVSVTNAKDLLSDSSQSRSPCFNLTKSFSSLQVSGPSSNLASPPVPPSTSDR